MNIIFGKYQLSLPVTNSSNQITNKSGLCIHRFIKVSGLGATKVKWVLSIIGGTQSLRIFKFYKNSKLMNRETQIENIVRANHFRFLGVELKQLVSNQKAKANKFVPSSRQKKNRPAGVRAKKARK